VVWQAAQLALANVGTALLFSALHAPGNAKSLGRPVRPGT